MAAITEKKTNSKYFFQGRCFYKNTSQKTFREVKVSIQLLFWSIFCLKELVSFALFLRLANIASRRPRWVCCARNYDNWYKKWNVNPHFSTVWWGTSSSVGYAEDSETQSTNSFFQVVVLYFLPVLALRFYGHTTEFTVFGANYHSNSVHELSSREQLR